MPGCSGTCRWSNHDRESEGATGLPLKPKRESEKAIMVPNWDRIDVWWNLATALGRTQTRLQTRFVLDETDNFIDAPPARA
jgi:hypothetical protein